VHLNLFHDIFTPSVHVVDNALALNHIQSFSSLPHILFNNLWIRLIFSVLERGPNTAENVLPKVIVLILLSLAQHVSVEGEDDQAHGERGKPRCACVCVGGGG